MNTTDVEVVNVVATGGLADRINLEYFYSAAKNQITVVRYDPEHHQGCYLRFAEGGSLITIYNSGKYIIRASSTDAVYSQKQMLVKKLKEMRVPEKVEEEFFRINNIVGNADIGRQIDLETLCEDLTRGEASHHEKSGRITYYIYDNRCTINIFRTGKVVIMGAQTTNQLVEAWTELIDELTDLFGD